MRKRFTAPELLERLEHEAARSVHNARERNCEGPLPAGHVFTLDLATLCGVDEVVTALLHPDGRHRPDARISPIAVTDDAVVLHVTYEPAWTDVILEGDRAFPVEPFILMGPSLPLSWRGEGEPPRVRLPTWPEWI